MLDNDMQRLTEMMGSRLFGKYRGRVVNNEDGQARGRLQVVVPRVMGTQPTWALPCVPNAGADGTGFFAIPPVESLVWVEFEAGDINHPIWTGCFWAKDKLDSADAAPGVQFWKTAKFMIRIDDDADELTIQKLDGSTITISASEINAEADSVVQTAGGNTTKLSMSSFSALDGALEVV